MKVRLIIPNPHVKPIHVKHVAATFTMLGGLSEAFISAVPHLGAVFFVLGGCMAIYEPHLTREVSLNDE